MTEALFLCHQIPQTPSTRLSLGSTGPCPGEIKMRGDAIQAFAGNGGQTLEYHYGKHHKSYVDKLNSLVAGTEFE